MIAAPGAVGGSWGVSVDASIRSPGVAVWAFVTDPIDGDRWRVERAGQPAVRLPDGRAARWIADFARDALPAHAWESGAYWIASEWPATYPGRVGVEATLRAMREIVETWENIAEPARTTRYRPAEWKGQVPKSITTDRLARRVAIHPSLHVPRGATDAWDAIGIGAFHLGIVGRGCV